MRARSPGTGRGICASAPIGVSRSPGGAPIVRYGTEPPTGTIPPTNRPRPLCVRRCGSDPAPGPRARPARSPRSSPPDAERPGGRGATSGALYEPLTALSGAILRDGLEGPHDRLLTAPALRVEPVVDRRLRDHADIPLLPGPDDPVPNRRRALQFVEQSLSRLG